MCGQGGACPRESRESGQAAARAGCASLTGMLLSSCTGSVLAVSVALVVGLILWFESRDASELEGSGVPAPLGSPTLPDERRFAAHRRANTITRWAAL